MPAFFWMPYYMIVCCFRCLNTFRRLPSFVCHVDTVKVRLYCHFLEVEMRCTEVESFTWGGTQDQTHWVTAKIHLTQETVLNGVSNGDLGQGCKSCVLSCISHILSSQLLATVSVGTFWGTVESSRPYLTTINTEAGWELITYKFLDSLL